LVGESSVLTQVRQSIDRVAATDSRVLVTGPPGAGKSVVARLLHDRSARQDGPFVVLNCATLQADTLETALFGSEKSEDESHIVGLLEQAHGGTLLLDEVADMSLDTQGKIVRMLHSQRFKRVGGNQWIEVDVRVVATTHRDLQALMAEEQFREDLYYRLNVVPIEVPPLSARREDIPLLTQYFMSRSAAAKGRAPRDMNEDAIASLQAYDWPGNVWELVNVVERLLLLAPGGLDTPISAEVVLQATGQDGSEVMRWDRAPEIMNRPLREAREAFETEYLLFHVTRFGGNISRTAEFVGMDRAALHRKLKMLGVQNAVRPQKISA
jgi:two-component system nitrogen regulation response regulator NtrX